MPVLLPLARRLLGPVAAPVKRRWLAHPPATILAARTGRGEHGRATGRRRRRGARRERDLRRALRGRARGAGPARHGGAPPGGPHPVREGGPGRQPDGRARGPGEDQQPLRRGPRDRAQLHRPRPGAGRDSTPRRQAAHGGRDDAGADRALRPQAPGGAGIPGGAAAGRDPADRRVVPEAAPDDADAGGQAAAQHGAAGRARPAAPRRRARAAHGRGRADRHEAQPVRPRRLCRALAREREPPAQRLARRWHRQPAWRPRADPGAEGPGGAGGGTGLTRRGPIPSGKARHRPTIAERFRLAACGWRAYIEVHDNPRTGERRWRRARRGPAARPRSLRPTRRRSPRRPARCRTRSPGRRPPRRRRRSGSSSWRVRLIVIGVAGPPPSPDAPITPREGSTLTAYKDKDFGERLSTAAAARKATLERFRAKPGPDDPAVAERRAARQALVVAREARLAEREAARKVEKAREAAREEEAARQAAEQTGRDVALEAERKAARDARYAARKARR